MKQHVLTSREGIPLVIQTGPANENDHVRLEGLLEAMPKVPTMAGTVRKVLAVLADAGYGVAWVIAMVIGMGYKAKIKPRGKEGETHGSGLGKKRYVVERTLAWLYNDRRLRVCYERTGKSWQAFHELAACVFCAKRLDAARQP